MRHLVYSVGYSVVPINSSLLTITLYFSVITTLVYNVTDVIAEVDCSYLRLKLKTVGRIQHMLRTQ
jgi:hypothetical protein